MPNRVIVPCRGFLKAYDLYYCTTSLLKFEVAVATVILEDILGFSTAASHWRSIQTFSGREALQFCDTVLALLALLSPLNYELVQYT
jgi:hypothetical protein